MKRFFIITGLLLLVALGAVTVWHCTQTATPMVSDLYRRYEHQEGVRVGFVHQFPMDDSTLVDVTTIEALDSTGWEWMREEFNFPTLSERQGRLVAEGQDVLQTWQLEDGTEGSEQFVFLSYGHHSLCIVQVDNEQQLNSVISYQLKQLD